MSIFYKRSIDAVIFLFVLLAVATLARADVTVRSRQTASGQTYENTTLIKGKRQRTEMMNGAMITIQQCDLRRDIQIMTQAGVYKVTRYEQPADSPQNANINGPLASAPARGGVITSTISTRDTGERKQMFGYTARHLISTMTMTSSPDACNQVNTKMEIDGWYIDADFVLECDQNRNPYAGNTQSPRGCQDRYEFKQIGAARRGYAVQETTNMFDPNGKVIFSTTNEVIELSQATLDASLFEVPAGYREVQDFTPASMSASSTTNRSQNDQGQRNNTPAPTPEPAAKPSSGSILKKIGRPF
jgi:hypothetical protein